MTSAPILTTDRLTLRPHVPEDFPAYRDLMTSERSRFMGGPYTPKAAWGVFCHDVACWALFGHGALAVDHEGAFVGQVGVSAGPLFPERELGWTVLAGHEGRGFMTEAAAALRAWVQPRFPGRLVSYIDPGNTRSIAVAERLGARLDPDAVVQDPGDLVYLHPSPEDGP